MQLLLQKIGILKIISHLLKVKMIYTLQLMLNLPMGQMKLKHKPYGQYIVYKIQKVLNIQKN